MKLLELYWFWGGGWLFGGADDSRRCGFNWLEVFGFLVSFLSGRVTYFQRRLCQEFGIISLEVGPAGFIPDFMGEIRGRSWQYQCHKAYQLKGPSCMPSDFIDREDQWEFLYMHFKSDVFNVIFSFISFIVSLGFYY